jgi:hypothetical protein
MPGSDQTPRGELARLASALGLYKLLFLGLALATPLLLPGFFSHEAWLGNFHWPPERAPEAFAPLETWDAQHYLYLADEGYSRRRMPIAFFPLFPWLVRAVAILPGVSPLAAALAISNLASLSALVLLFALVRRRWPGAQWPTLLLVAAFPGALFFHLPYTESVFLLLALLVFDGLDRRRYDMAAVAAFLLALTRPNGVLIGAVLLWDLLVRWREGRPLRPLHFAAVVAPALGLAFYFVMMQIVTGDAMAGIEMQRAFHADRSIANLFDLPRLVANLADVKVLHGVSNSLLDRLAFLFVLGTLLPLWRLDKRLFWFTLPMGLLGPLSGSLVSYTRFAAVLFPCFVVLGRSLSDEERRPWLYLTTAAFMLVQVTLALRHVSFRWAG